MCESVRVRIFFPFLSPRKRNRISNKNEFLSHFGKHISIIRGSSERSRACGEFPNGQKRDSEECNFPRIHFEHFASFDRWTSSSSLPRHQRIWSIYIVLLQSQQHYHSHYGSYCRDNINIRNEIVSSKIISEFNQ